MLLGLFWLFFVVAGFGKCHATNISYDGRSLIIDGKHQLLFSGSIHYPRSLPEMWSSLIKKAKQGGIDVIDTYVFWNLHESQQGQIENEYERIEGAFEDNSGSRYVHWAADFAVGLKTGVPWIMCSQTDAPDPLINTCNGFRCGEKFGGPNSPDKPSMWTENWTGLYGEEPFVRSAEEIAFSVAEFIAKKQGSYVNYYMYHGGTNFGRTAAARIITSYYDQAPLDEYGFTRQPLWGHLKELHAVVKLCTQPLLFGSYEYSDLGEDKEAHVFKGESGECAAFLINNDNTTTSAKVHFQNSSFHLPPMSISILPDCKNVAFNTAKVTTQQDTRSMSVKHKFDSSESWEEFREPIPTFSNTSLKAQELLGHMTTTNNTSDYLWYTVSYQHDSDAKARLLYAISESHVLHLFVNGTYIGYAHGGKKWFKLEEKVHLNKGTNEIALLSVMVGFPDSGAFLERKTLGIINVTIQSQMLNNYKWGYQVGLTGESLSIFTKHGSKKVEWTSFQGKGPRLTQFDAPEGKDPLALNLGSMGKGEVWVNGQSIGRYWVSLHTPQNRPSQTWYNVPRGFLKSKGNLLVILEEEYGDPVKITLDTVSISN
ncbi:Glycoside hydrolase, family 35 [Corchorus olitorius]|uniref:beta-galactosidase n=1 Tax=Corchorus olitorius TaxID=93759 RepID=A0A1R3HP02_9ROSI|nr:Glycoside hydrolase, family 35 [Corchorus olitorius]